jgi:hypothetical protein
MLRHLATLLSWSAALVQEAGSWLGQVCVAVTSDWLPDWALTDDERPRSA